MPIQLLAIVVSMYLLNNLFPILHDFFSTKYLSLSSITSGTTCLAIGGTRPKTPPLATVSPNPTPLGHSPWLLQGTTATRCSVGCSITCHQPQVTTGGIKTIWFRIRWQVGLGMSARLLAMDQKGRGLGLATGPMQEF